MSPLRAIVVGGSLSGLCAALALAADGAEVAVFERDRELGVGGAGLGVDRRLLGRITDASPFGDATVPALSVITSNRDSTAWTLIHQWLRNLIDHRPRITVHHGRRISWAWYVPTRLVAGRVALIGDAAHVSSPMTGSGFHYSLLDVLSLRQALAGIADDEKWRPTCGGRLLPYDALPRSPRVYRSLGFYLWLRLYSCKP